mmetsp:Transcript_39741/g.84837  ORF Transcript_39741/g.84837 Transcript_39741/m.84837 type:complete len:200 (+) Transcript_39741:1965-2564(+)
MQVGMWTTPPSSSSSVLSARQPISSNEIAWPTEVKSLSVSPSAAAPSGSEHGCKSQLHCFEVGGAVSKHSLASRTDWSKTSWHCTVRCCLPAWLPSASFTQSCQALATQEPNDAAFCFSSSSASDTKFLLRCQVFCMSASPLASSCSSSQEASPAAQLPSSAAAPTKARIARYPTRGECIRGSAWRPKRLCEGRLGDRP